MEDQFSPEAKSEVFEREVGQITKEIEKYRENPEAKTLDQKELLGRAIQSLNPSLGNKTQTSPKDDSSLNSLKNAPPAAKLEVEHLLSMAFKEGIAKAVSEASQSSPFVLDAFHGALTGELYNEI